MQPTQGRHRPTADYPTQGYLPQGQSSSSIQRPHGLGQLTGAGYAHSMNYGNPQPSTHWNPARQHSLGTYGQPHYPRASQLRPGVDYAVSSHSELAHALDPSRIRYRPSAESERRAKAAATLVKTIRGGISKSVRSAMLAKGDDWQFNLNENGATRSVEELSAENMSALRLALRNPPLARHEKDFLDKMLKTPLFITHATDANVFDQHGNVALYSRDKLVSKGIAFAEDHSEEIDLDVLGNSDHVFFSVEVGDTPQKKASRFGSTLLRFPFDQPSVTLTGMMFLVDPVQIEMPSPKGYFESLERLPRAEKKAIIDDLQDREYEMSDCIYQGKDMKVGLTLAIIEECRKMPPAVAYNMLTREKPNDLINRLFRPQVMVPKHFFGKPHDVSRVQKFDL